MSRNIFATSGSSMSREQRWEARRQAKFQPEPSVSNQDIKPPPQYDYPKPSMELPYPSQEFSSVPQDPFRPPQYNPDPSIKYPSQDLYRSDSKPSLQPNNPNQNLPNTSLQSSPNPDLLKKKAYALELQKQMEERKNTKKKPSPNTTEYFPFGKQGAGAPMRDIQGNIIALRPPKYNENDPNFLNPGEFYKKQAALVHSRSQQVIGFREDPRIQQQTSPRIPTMGFVQSGMPAGYQQGGPQGFGQGYQQGLPPQVGYGQREMQYVPQGFGRADPSQFGMQYGGGQGNGGFGAQYGGGMGNLPPNMGYGGQFYQNGPEGAGTYMQGNMAEFHQPLYEPKPQPVYDPKPQYTQENPRNSSDSPKPFFKDPQEEENKSIERTRKLELGKVLLQQAEEKRRKIEEEKRQKILEERLEEERLARQRREIEEQRRLEEEKGRKKFQELQEFNSKLVLEPKGRPKRIRTPYEPPAQDFPPVLPPAPKSRGEVQITTTHQTSLPGTFMAPAVPLVQDSRKIEQFYNSQGPNLVSIRQDLEQGQNNLKQEILKLKSENLEAQEQRIDAQRELLRLREEFKQKELMDDIRQREILTALHNTKGPSYEPRTTLPPYKPLPYKLVEGRGDASLSLDPMKSLPSSTKMIPLPNPEINFPTLTQPPDPNLQFKKALHLDSLFPSLPENDAANVSVTSNRTANSSIGLDKVNKKNDERLKFLDNFENKPDDELKKLDDILFKFQPKEAPSIRHSTHKQPLNQIEEEDEAEYSLPKSDYSLPRSQASSDFQPKWNKDWVDY